MNRQSARFVITGVILLVAIVAFEIFNFDTTRFALINLLGEKQFGGLTWASILATAFCGIDFAGLLHIFNPEQEEDDSPLRNYLFGAWLAGATLNAIMTWYAVGITLLERTPSNSMLTQEELLRYVPIFLAALVWLTRILFIGAISVMGDALLAFVDRRRVKQPKLTTRRRPVRARSGGPSTNGTSYQPVFMEDDEL